MEAQRFFIKGRILAAEDPGLQDALACVYDTPERPRCLCVQGGVDMYVAKHRLFLVKRMPDSAQRHHPSCPSYEPELTQSGLGELIGDSVIEHAPDAIELRVDFPLARTIGKPIPRGERLEPTEIKSPRHRMTLRAVLHYLFERARLNHWVPAMEGKRNQGVIHKYLMEAAEDVTTKGVRLAERLYVPEPFSEMAKDAIAERRHAKLAVLHSPTDSSEETSERDVQFKMGLLIGEFKTVEPAVQGRKVWVKHMPDTPLFIDGKAWERVERVYGEVLEGRDVDCKRKPRALMGALIYARRERVYQIHALTLMLVTDQWIPIEALHELPLINELVDQHRRFVKPLRYDASTACSFPNALLLDAGEAPIPLQVVSPFMQAKERSAKDKAIREGEAGQPGIQWIWHTDQPMPPLPVTASPLRGQQSTRQSASVASAPPSSPTRQSSPSSSNVRQSRLTST